MNITIKNIMKNSDKIFVEYSTPYGNGVSEFIGSTPEENQSYDVEFNIDDDLSWGENLTPSKKNAASIHFDLGKTYITAELIAIEDDDCGALKIGNSISLVSIKKNHHDLPLFVDIVSKKNSIYPTNI
jgi:hypothetical protein